MELICTNCAAEMFSAVEDDEVYCSRCGTHHSIPDTESDESEDALTPHIPTSIAVGLIVFFVLIGSLFFGLTINRLGISQSIEKAMQKENPDPPNVVTQLSEPDPVVELSPEEENTTLKSKLAILEAEWEALTK